jgi:hypothetical protein
MTIEYVDHDTVRVWTSETGGKKLEELIAVLYRGDDLEVLERQPSATRVRLGPNRVGWVRAPLRTTQTPPLALAFIDVGQGDACLMTTPSGHRILVDGGENKLAARYLAGRFWDQTVAGQDVHFDAIVVTHGDADHFDGLSTLVLDAVAETRERKRIRVTASRVFHNGLVKRDSSLRRRKEASSLHLSSMTRAPRRTLIGPSNAGPRRSMSSRAAPLPPYRASTIRRRIRSTSSAK